MLTRRAISVTGGSVASASLISKYDEPQKAASTASNAYSGARLCGGFHVRDRRSGMTLSLGQIGARMLRRGSKC